jgi:hypothetical protein
MYTCFWNIKTPTAQVFLQTTNLRPIWLNLERVGKAGAGWGHSGGTAQRSPGRFRRPGPDTALTVAAGQSGDVQEVILPDNPLKKGELKKTISIASTTVKRMHSERYCRGLTRTILILNFITEKGKFMYRGYLPKKRRK